VFGLITIPLAGAFFFSSWLAMVFWGMIVPDLGIATISYPKAMLLTIAVWLVVFPVTWIGRGRRRRMWEWHHRREQAFQSSGEDDVDISAVFAGSARKISSGNFKGGRISAVFGGAEVDLRNAVVEQRPVRLVVSAVFGGVEIKVPSGWKVEINTSSVLGGTADDRKHSGSVPEGPPHLVIEGTVVFGGISVKD